jgi:hemoglobin-like flavoprotein
MNLFYQNSMLIVAPNTKILFGFDANADIPFNVLEKNTQFVTCTTEIVETIDLVLNMLGPDMDAVVSLLKDLSMKYRKLGVTPELLIPFRIALMETLECLLGGAEFHGVMKKSWETVYDLISQEMR